MTSCRGDAVHVRLIDIDFDFKGVHIHDRGDTRPGEPAAGGDRRYHLPRLRILVMPCR